MRILRRRRILPGNRTNAGAQQQPPKRNWPERWLPYADLMLKAVSIIAFGVAGWWTYSQYLSAGGDEWMVNVEIQTEVLPYKDDLRMLVVHVKSKNPWNRLIEFDKAENDSYTLTARKVATGLKAGATVDLDKGESIGEIDLMPTDSVYSFVPNAELDDVKAFILPVNTLVSLSAQLSMPGSDFVRAQKVVEVKP